MYDYLVVGSGLYGAIFAHEAKKAGKSVPSSIFSTIFVYPPIGIP
jgi:glycine/D-amino acid oxidase-like deaminating enzyme